MCGTGARLQGVYFVFLRICMCAFVIQPFGCNTVNKVELRVTTLHRPVDDASACT